MKKAGHDPHFKTYESPLKTRFRILQPGESSFRLCLAGKWRAIRYGDTGSDQGKRINGILYWMSPIESIENMEQDRYLMRKTMQGLLPDEVRLNKKRGLQAADKIYRVRAEGNRNFCRIR